MSIGFKIKYKIDNNGCHICVSHSKNPNGYPVIQRNYKRQLLSRYTYEQNFGKIPTGLIIRHKCDNPACINIEHLELGTQKDNVQDMIKRGRKPIGENSPVAKLTDEQVREIRESKLSCIEIGRKYGINRRYVYNLKNKTQRKDA